MGGSCAQVLVAGGGPAGLAAAIALAERECDVLVVDPGPPAAALDRHEMLPGAALPILQRVGLAALPGRSVALAGAVSLWGGARPVDHAAALPRLGAFGWSIDRAALHDALRARAGALGVRRHRGRVQNVTGWPDSWRVAAGRELRARFLVDATGRPAALARRLGARLSLGPDLVGMTCNVAQPVPPKLLAEATPEGWCYALPRQDGGASLGFMTSRRGVRRPGFLARAARDLRLVPRPGHPAAGHVSDSRNARLCPVAGPSWLATGDAAAAFDPVASQGLFNALSAGFFAGNAAADAVAGDAQAVPAYVALCERTAARSHGLIPLQYAARPFDTDFWAGGTGRIPERRGANYGL